MLALRQCQGVDITWLSQWLDCDFQTEYKKAVKNMLDEEGKLIQEVDYISKEEILFQKV